MSMRRVLVAALVLAALPSCGTGAPGRDVVTLWMYPVIEDQARGEEFWHRVETGFEAGHHVDLRIELQPWEGRQEKLGAALMSGAFLVGIKWGAAGLAWAWLGGMAALLAATALTSLPTRAVCDPNSRCCSQQVTHVTRSFITDDWMQA